jgi:hypothetical protein
MVDIDDPGDGSGSTVAEVEAHEPNAIHEIRAAR